MVWYLESTKQSLRHTVYIYVCVCVLSYSAVSDCLAPHGLYPARLLCPWDFPGNITGVGCHFLLQAIFLTEEPGRLQSMGSQRVRHDLATKQ